MFWQRISFFIIISAFAFSCATGTKTQRQNFVMTWSGLEKINNQSQQFADTNRMAQKIPGQIQSGTRHEWNRQSFGENKLRDYWSGRFMPEQGGNDSDTANQEKNGRAKYDHGNSGQKNNTDNSQWYWHMGMQYYSI